MIGGLLIIAVLLPLALTRTVPRTPTAAATPSATGSPETSGTPSAAAVLTLPGRAAPVLVFGDSYASGYAADPPTTGYANLLAERFRWRLTVSSEGGAGYLTRGAEGRTYLDRVLALPESGPELILVQGGLNDAAQLPSANDVSSAAVQVLQALHDKYPSAELVVLGPIGVDAQPRAGLAAVDRGLAAATASSGVPYISPLHEEWDIAPYLIADGIHPNTQGHRYITDRLAVALEELAQGATVTNGG